MIAGLGVDLVRVARVRELHARWGARLERRVMNRCERAALPHRPAARLRRLALGVAAKEALSKALGTGLRWPATWHQIAVRRSARGGPRYEFGAELSAQLAERGIAHAHLTLSDDGGMAVAVAVLER